MSNPKVVCPSCQHTLPISNGIITKLQKKHALNTKCPHCGEVFSISATPATRKEKKK